METVVQASDPADPATLAEVLAALRKQKLAPIHESKDWGDWIHLEGCATVISIESMRGLTTTATIEHGENEREDPSQAILRAFHGLGWVGIDEEGEYPLG